MATAMTAKLLQGARGAVSACAGAVRHAAWYVSYHVDGQARHQGTDAARVRRPARMG
jgi:hypothetical protein